MDRFIAPPVPRDYRSIVVTPEVLRAAKTQTCWYSRQTLKTMLCHVVQPTMEN